MLLYLSRQSCFLSKIYGWNLLLRSCSQFWFLEISTKICITVANLLRYLGHFLLYDFSRARSLERFNRTKLCFFNFVWGLIIFVISKSYQIPRPLFWKTNKFSEDQQVMGIIYDMLLSSYGCTNLKGLVYPLYILKGLPWIRLC